MTQTVPDISPLMPMHQDPLLVINCKTDSYCDIAYRIGSEFFYAYVVCIISIKPLRLPKSALGEQQSHFSFDFFFIVWSKQTAHELGTLSALQASCRGNPLVLGGFPSQRDSNFELRFFVWLCSGLPCIHHDDVIKCKHFPRYRPFVRRIHRLWCFLWSTPE